MVLTAPKTLWEQAYDAVRRGRELARKRGHSRQHRRALLLLEQVKAQAQRQNLSLIWADEGFAGIDFEKQVQEQFGWKLEITFKEVEQ